MDNTVYATYVFKDKTTDHVIRTLVLNKNANPSEKINKTIRELMAHYSLSESEIVVEN